MELSRYFTFLITILGFASCVSCSVLTRKSKEVPAAEEKKPVTGLDAYQRAGGRVGGAATAGQLGASNGASVAAVGITRSEDIVWAPENPEEAITGGFEELWEQPENRSWHISYTKALRQSRESGKPVLIWFTNSQRSPLCKALSNELFSGASFDSWASERLIRLRVDDVISGVSKEESEWTEKTNYIEKLKGNYKVHGNPTVVILSSRGSSVANYRGYKRGTADYYWARMKNAVTRAEEDYGVWRESLEKRGYRMWSNRKGQKTFSKLHRFKDGRLTLIDPDGKRGVTSFTKLSDADQTWVMQEKKKYDERQQR